MLGLCLGEVRGEAQHQATHSSKIQVVGSVWSAKYRYMFIDSLVMNESDNYILCPK